MRKPCVADLVTARELVEHGVMAEGAKALVDLRRCAADCGCDDWQNCDNTIQEAWRAATHQPLPDARPKPEHLDQR